MSRTTVSNLPRAVRVVPDFGFEEIGELVLVGQRTEAELFDAVDDLAQIIGALVLVLTLSENFNNFVFGSVGVGGSRLEAA